MTVVLALTTAEGLVIGSDSQITEKDRGMSYPAQKLHDLAGRAAWGGSGARSVLIDVERKLDSDAAAVLDASLVSHALQERVIPVLRHHYENFIETIPGEDGAGSPAAYVLAAGYQGDRPWIIEINPHGMVSHYEDVGFHAIGSGAPMAQQAGTLLSHFRMSERSLQHGVLALVRVLDALTVNSPSVGGPLEVCRVTPEGTDHLEQDEMEEIRADVHRWVEQEHRLLDELFG
jgi:proteasome beta subunit